MDYNQMLNELYSLDSSKFKLGIENIKGLLEKLGNPEKNLRCIHVAGTNGKGSVCAMLYSILINAGYNVGMYTSPHLKKFNERIRVNDKQITNKEIVEYYLKIKNFRTNCSFFEITTAMAFMYFKEKNVDFVVLEVGLGGRLDATNVVNPLISVITNIGLEHTNILGGTLEKIAYEKSGIIKENVPVVTAAEGSALETIKKISDERNSKLVIVNKNRIKIKHNKEKFNKIKNNNKNSIVKNKLAFDYKGYKNLKLGLMGKFQAYNAAVALEAISILKNRYKAKINKKNIISGLKNAEWPGRLQFIGRNVLIDCAHNPHGFRILADELKNLNYKKLILVAGFSNDKNIKEMASIIKRKAYKTIITKSKSEKAENPAIIKKYFNKNSSIIKNPKKALRYAKKIAEKNDLILVTGSIYMVGEII